VGDCILTLSEQMTVQTVKLDAKLQEVDNQMSTHYKPAEENSFDENLMYFLTCQVIKVVISVVG
jgi:hypothetical protein